MLYKNKIVFKLIIILIIIAMVFPLLGNVSLAVPAEPPPKPPGHLPSDDPGKTSPTPTRVDTHEEKWVEETRYTYIEGHAYETSSNESDAVSVPKRPIAGVRINEDMVTDENGYYKIEGVGEYHIDFKYGDLGALQLDNTLTVQDVLQYNGYDFRVSDLTNGTYTADTKTTTQHEIIESGKGAAQVYLVIDVSISMLDEVEINGVKQTKLKATLNAAKTLIHNLLAGDDNIYVGIVIFAMKTSRVASVTRDEEFLNYAMDKIESLVESGGYYGTNIVKALDKAYDSFAVDESDPDWKEHCNRNIILLSDGVATQDYSTELLASDSAEENRYKAFEQIGPSTKQKIQDFIAEGINIMALLNDDPAFYEDDTHEYIEFIYKNTVSRYELAKDEEDLIKKIIEDVKEWIKQQIKKEDQYKSKTTIISGYEDEERRKEVDRLFEETFYYNVKDLDNPNNDINQYLSPRSSLFKEIDNPTRNITEGAKELSELTYMTVNGGTFDLEEPGKDRDEVIHNHWCEECQKEHDYTIHYRYNNTGYTQDLTLERRQEGQLYTKVTATALKLTLNEGTVLSFQEREMNDVMPLLEVLDDYVSHGTTIEVEYTIEVINHSSFQFDHLELVDYIPKELTYIPETHMLTSRGKNSDYNWNLTTIRALYNKGYGYISKEAYENYGEGYTESDYNDLADSHVPKAIVMSIDNEGKGNKGFYLPPNNTYTTKVVLSRVLSEADDITGTIENEVEVIGYHNNANRRTAIARTTFTTDKNSKMLTLLGIFPGDKKIYDPSEITTLINDGSGTGVDFAESSNKVFIVPPTGGSTLDTRNIIIVTAAVLSAIGTMILFKKNKKK